MQLDHLVDHGLDDDKGFVPGRADGLWILRNFSEVRKLFHFENVFHVPEGLDERDHVQMVVLS